MFSTKNQSYLGIDISSTGVKVVELMNVNGAPELITYGQAEYQVSRLTGQSGNIQPKEIIATLRQVLKTANVKSTLAYGALPTEKVFNSIINLPTVEKKAQTQAINEEATKLLPLPLAEMVLDPQILETKTSDGSQQVLLVAAPKKLVEQYQEIYVGAGLKLMGLETESFAIIRSLLGRDSAAVAMIDIGAFTTDIVIVEDGVPHLTRSLAVGGHAVTQMYSKRLAVDMVAAEQMKRDVGLQGAGRGEMPAIAADTIYPIVNEIKFTLDLYASEHGRRVEKVILTGGSSLLAGFSEHLSDLIKTRVYIGDPWARVRYPLELQGVLQFNAPQFAVAVGAALLPLK